MPTYNFKCDTCEKLERDIYYSVQNLPHVRPCSCGGDMEQDYSNHGVGYSDSGYPYTDPQTGLTYTSATDKRKQLIAHGYEEGDWKKGGMSRAQQRKHDAYTWEKERPAYETARDNNGSVWMDDESLAKSAKA